VYDRRYEGKVLGFEPSGGLLNAALVMRDRETDSWWSIITGDAIGGELQGAPLKELPVGEKTQWGKWRKAHPNTLVLSIDGKEHELRDPYAGYFTSPDGFRGLSSEDTRLSDKASIYAFQLDGTPYAVPHTQIEGGAVFQIDKEREVFLYRVPGSEIFASTLAYISKRTGKESRFSKNDGRWYDTVSGAVFDEEKGFPLESDGSLNQRAAARLTGFDTFWYTWTTTHQSVVLLGPSG
jgi:hypothetical protein